MGGKSSLRELITAKPVQGWGEDPKKVEAVIKDAPEALAMFREAMVQKSGQRNDLGNNVTEDDTGITGNSRAYSIARVKRECDEETVAAVMAGTVTPNAAGSYCGGRSRSEHPSNRSLPFAKHLLSKSKTKRVSPTTDPHDHFHFWTFVDVWEISIGVTDHRSPRSLPLPSILVTQITAIQSTFASGECKGGPKS